MSRKKILHTVTRLERGGTLTAVLSLLEGLSSDYDIVLALGEVNSEKAAITASAEKFGYRIVWLKDLVREISPVKDFLSLLDIIDIIAHEQPHTLHTHTSKAGFLGRIAAGLSGFKQVIHTPHGHVFYGYFGRVKTGVIVLMERLAAHFTRSFIVFSKSEYNDNLKRNIGKGEQYFTIPNGIDERLYEIAVDAVAKKEELGLPAGKKLLGYAGRFAPVKGCDIFVEALKLLSKKRDDFVGVIGGSGTKPEELKLKAEAGEMIDKGLIKFIGFRQDLPEVLKVFDVFVLPSRNEGFGLSAVEAHFAGIPVIASSVGGLPDIIINGKTGMLIKPENPEALASALDTLLNDPALAALLVKNAKERVMERFTLNAMLKSVKELYERA